MKLFNVKLTDLHENSWNSNRMDEEHFDGLVQSISDYPDMLKAERVIVRDIESGYEILGGAHRFRAAKLLEFEEIPVGSVGIVSDDKAKLISLILNNRGTESYDRKMDVIYSIKAIYNVSDIARKIGVDAVRLNGVIDSMGVGVDAMADIVRDTGAFEDAVSDGFKLRIDPPQSPKKPMPIGDDPQEDYGINSNETMEDSFFGVPNPTETLDGSPQQAMFVVPVKANIKKALKIGIGDGKTVFEIINKACKLYVGE